MRREEEHEEHGERGAPAGTDRPGAGYSPAPEPVPPNAGAHPSPAERAEEEARARSEDRDSLQTAGTPVNLEAHDPPSDSEALTCRTCGHRLTQHEEQQTELNGEKITRIVCVVCDSLGLDTFIASSDPVAPRER